MFSIPINSDKNAIKGGVRFSDAASTTGNSTGSGSDSGGIKTRKSTAENICATLDEIRRGQHQHTIPLLLSSSSCTSSSESSLSELDWEHCYPNSENSEEDNKNMTSRMSNFIGNINHENDLETIFPGNFLSSEVAVARQLQLQLHPHIITDTKVATKNETTGEKEQQNKINNNSSQSKKYPLSEENEKQHLSRNLYRKNSNMNHILPNSRQKQPHEEASPLLFVSGSCREPLLDCNDYTYRNDATKISQWLDSGITSRRSYGSSDVGGNKNITFTKIRSAEKFTTTTTPETKLRESPLMSMSMKSELSQEDGELGREEEEEFSLATTSTSSTAAVLQLQKNTKSCKSASPFMEEKLAYKSLPSKPQADDATNSCSFGTNAAIYNTPPIIKTSKSKENSRSCSVNAVIDIDSDPDEAKTVNNCRSRINNGVYAFNDRSSSSNEIVMNDEEEWIAVANHGDTHLNESLSFKKNTADSNIGCVVVDVDHDYDYGRDHDRAKISVEIDGGDDNDNVFYINDNMAMILSDYNEDVSIDNIDAESLEESLSYLVRNVVPLYTNLLGVREDKKDGCHHSKYYHSHKWQKMRRRKITEKKRQQWHLFNNFNATAGAFTCCMLQDEGEDDDDDGYDGDDDTEDEYHSCGDDHCDMTETNTDDESDYYRNKSGRCSYHNRYDDLQDKYNLLDSLYTITNISRSIFC